jgi:hypothetical protein
MPGTEWPPPWWKDFPPDWMKPEVCTVFGLVASSTLYTRTGLAEHGYGWLKPEAGQSAHYAGDDVSETAHILVERGYLLWGESAELTDESGDGFTADRLVFTPSGRELHEQLSKGK